MKYMKLDKMTGSVEEVTMQSAKEVLEQYWLPKSIEEAFASGKMFRLFTPYSEYYTQNGELTPMAGFYGICD